MSDGCVVSGGRKDAEGGGRSGKDVVRNILMVVELWMRRSVLI